MDSVTWKYILSLALGRDEIHFQIPHLADGNIIAAAQQLKVDYVFNDVASIHIAEPQQIIAQAGIHNVILAQGPQIFLCP